MKQQDFDSVVDDLEKVIRKFADEHPRLKKMSALARRNLAYCGALGGMSALTEDDLRKAR